MGFLCRLKKKKERKKKRKTTSNQQQHNFYLYTLTLKTFAYHQYKDFYWNRRCFYTFIRTYTSIQFVENVIDETHFLVRTGYIS